MDPLLEFLEKIDVLIKKNKKINLKGFVDDEMTKVYKDLLMEDRIVPKINLTFEKLNNDTLRRSLLLNYYFDHTYVLNLDRRPDRLNAMKRSLNKLGIYNWSKFTAIDGKKEPHYTEWSNYRKQRMTQMEKRRYHRKAIASAGSWAILKSMYLMLRDALEKKYETILVFQDDLLFHKNYIEEFLSIPERVPKNWKLLYLGATQHNWEYVEYRTKYYFPMSCDGAFAVGIHNSIFKELMNEITKFDMPFDSGALKTIQQRYGRQCIVLSPNLAIADIRDSDLRSARDLDDYSKKFRWDLKLYDIDT
jgi:Glycosyltransferase family 25 (LPS biosynthesis protein)